MTTLSPIWFLEKPIDLEHKQYVLLDYIQKINKAFNEFKLTPYFFDLKFHIQNIDCFLSQYTILDSTDKRLTEEQNAILHTILERGKKSDDVLEAVEICKWSAPLMKETMKDGNKVWKQVESSLKKFYIGHTPKDVSHGFLLIRYGGSHIVEAYTFTGSKRGNVKIDPFGLYDMSGEKNYKSIKNQILLDSGDNFDPLFIGIESLQAFNSEESVIPVMSQILYKKVIV